MRTVKLIVTASLCLLPLVAFAQDAAQPISNGQINSAYDWVCSNRSTIEPIIEGVAAFTPLWGITHLIGIWAKKSSITKATPWLYKAWAILRAFNMDVHPTPATIVSNAAEVVASAPPAIRVASGANPVNMAAAAEALKTAAKA